MQPFLSVIIPAYNEAARLGATLSDLHGYLARQKFSCEIIVVDDGSGDETAEVVKSFIPLIENLKFLSYPENRGKGAAVRLGMLTAAGRWRLFMDADNSTSIAEFAKMPACFEAGCDVVIGSRSIEGSRLMPPQPLHKRILGKAGNLVIQALLTPGIWDTQCGFKCFSLRAAEKIFACGKIDGWGFDAEALALAKAFGYKIGEIPVLWINDLRTRVKPADYLRVLLDTFKVRLRLRRDGYAK